MFGEKKTYASFLNYDTAIKIVTEANDGKYHIFPFREDDPYIPVVRLGWRCEHYTIEVMEVIEEVNKFNLVR